VDFHAVGTVFYPAREFPIAPAIEKIEGTIAKKAVLPVEPMAGIIFAVAIREMPAMRFSHRA